MSAVGGALALAGGLFGAVVAGGLIAQVLTPVVLFLGITAMFLVLLLILAREQGR